jgi:hypothetical protein
MATPPNTTAINASTGAPKAKRKPNTGTKEVRNPRPMNATANKASNTEAIPMPDRVLPANRYGQAR